MSDSPDYSYVVKCFSGAASVLILPLCDEVYFSSSSIFEFCGVKL